MGFERLNGGRREKGKKRNENDYYPTHPFAVYSLVKHAEGIGTPVPSEVHEPAAGRGWIASEFDRLGHDVVATDLYPYEDTLREVHFGRNFLELEDSLTDACITNPPYTDNMAEKFVQHGLDLGYKYVAVLCRTMFVESQRRFKFYTKNPPTDIMHFSTRFSCGEHHFFERPLFGMVGYSWFVWDRRDELLTTAREGLTRTTWINARELHKEWLNSLTPDRLDWLKSKVTIPSETPKEEAAEQAELS